jgi:glutamine amidotransferase-like uncharacterized protein
MTLKKRAFCGLIVMILFLSIPFIVSGDMTKFEEIADVLIYSGTGTWSDGVIAFEKFLEFKGLTWYECDDLYIENNELVSNFDVIFFPGGDFTLYANNINSVGIQHIRDFVNEGGSYLGICGGGYFACDQVSWRGQTLDMPLDLFNGSGFGPIDEIAPYFEYDMTSITMNESNPINQYEHPNESILYYGGAAFYPYEEQEIEMIGSYDSYNNDTAILNFNYGNGRVLLCSPHPEVEEDSSRDNTSFADELSDAGTDWNILWTSLDWLLGIPISEPPSPLPPYVPEINGPVSGTPGIKYDYSFQVEDPEKEELYFWIEWGDETNTGWIGLYNSGEIITLNHIWDNNGDYTITAKAKDINGLIGPDGILEINMPRNHVINAPFLNFLQSHPNMFPLLQLLAQRLGLQ